MFSKNSAAFSFPSCSIFPITSGYLLIVAPCLPMSTPTNSEGTRNCSTTSPLARSFLGACQRSVQLRKFEI